MSLEHFSGEELHQVFGARVELQPDGSLHVHFRKGPPEVWIPAPPDWPTDGSVDALTYGGRTYALAIPPSDAN